MEQGNRRDWRKNFIFRKILESPSLLMKDMKKGDILHKLLHFFFFNNLRVSKCYLSS